ncbi:hypothetical protein FCL47_12815 [Desulfopila sp. IMCC35006]|uniref:hypothetical protein n=1 Tax=Desulfopila sp. IMCC35006 TaxID=2569542 RepID=UPI0010AB89BB|nr:hypothetical protein [Desulfopila sp. IMCC35006]TKB25960.1 hypothetical protein FCL47_12815 [Desulfopila sp. IMCC35006]
MSIRSLARELYNAQQNVAALQKKLDSAVPDNKDSLTQELRHAMQEVQMLRRMLDGEKESGTFRQRFSGFGSSKK